MIKLQPHRIDRLKPLFEQVVGDCCIEGKTNADNMTMFGTMVASGTGEVLVDNEDEPKAVVIISKNATNILYDQSVGGSCTVNLVFVAPEARSATLAKECHAEILNFARRNNCKYIMGGSLKFENSKDIDSFWEKGGYSPQETLFVKQL